MPGQGSTAGGDLTDEEILAVVCHERYTLGGADPTGDEYLEEYEDWCSDEAPTFVALEAGATLDQLADQGLTNAAGEEIADHRHRRRTGRRIAARRVTTSGRVAGHRHRRGCRGRRRRLVVGGGPGRRRAAYWLARAGHDVAIVEKKRFPRDKTCGDGLTPRAVKQLETWASSTNRRRPPLRRAAGPRHGHDDELDWPAKPCYPTWLRRAPP